MAAPGATRQERLAAARATLRKRLGLDGPVGALMEVGELFGDDDLDAGTADVAGGLRGAVGARAAGDVVAEMAEAGGADVSARERNRLKRKAKAAARAGGGDDKRARGGDNPEADAAETEADAAEDDVAAAAGAWPLQAFCEDALLDLFAPRWAARHGAALALRAALAGAAAQRIGVCAGAPAAAARAANAAWLCDAAIRLLCVLALDRFSDFAADGAVGPVRETAAQALAAAARPLPSGAVASASSALLSLAGRDDAWEARHGGLLGLKYLFAVRPHLAARLAPAALPGALAALRDADDDVRAAAADALAPAAAALAGEAPLRAALWRALAQLDDLSAAAAPVMRLLAALYEHPAAHHAASGADDLAMLLPRLWPLARHTVAAVRAATARTLQRLLAAAAAQQQGTASSSSWVAVCGADALRIALQGALLDASPSAAEAWADAWRSALRAASRATLDGAATAHAALWTALLATAEGGVADAALLLLPGGDATSAGRTERAQVPRSALGAYAGAAPSGAARARCAALLGALGGACGPVGADALGNALSAALGGASGAGRVAAGLALAAWAAADVAVPPGCRAALYAALDGAAATPDVPFAELARARAALRTDAAQLAAAAASAGVALPPALTAPVAAASAPGAPPLAPDAAAALAQAVVAVTPQLGAAATRLLATAGFLRTRGAELSSAALAAAAAAAVPLGELPLKLNALIQPLMAAARREREPALQAAAATALAALVDAVRCRTPSPADKVVRNLAAMAAADVAFTPQAASPVPDEDAAAPSGTAAPATATSAPASGDDVETAAAAAAAAEAGGESAAALSEAAVARRGADVALRALAGRLGAACLEAAPALWAVAGEPLSDAAALATISAAAPGDATAHAAQQRVIDALCLATLLAPALDDAPRAKLLAAALPACSIAGRARAPALRAAAASALASLAAALPAAALAPACASAVHLLEDTTSGDARRGGAAIAAALASGVPPAALAPCAVLLTVPLLGRMSDALPGVRAAATRAFAALLPLLPLARGAAPPPGLPPALAARAAGDAAFLSQLLDGGSSTGGDATAADPCPGVPLLLPLRPYQAEGVRWLAFLRRFGLSGALCDDMGLGKTLQATAALASDVAERLASGLPALPSLVVCPPTLVAHWAHETGRYLPPDRVLRCVAYAGTPAQRAAMRPQLRTAQLVVASYDTVRADADALSALDYAYVVLDEGHAIRNPRAATTRAVKRVAQRAARRLLLSGTPIQNDVAELWSLFDFLMPGFLGDEAQFRRRYGAGGSRQRGEVDALALGALHKQVMPFVLRRMKEEVLKELPPKVLTDVFVEPSPLQQHLYAAFEASAAKKDAEQALSSGVEGAEPAEGAQHAFAALQYMRKLCAHPALALAGVDDERKKALATRLGGAAAAAQPDAWLRGAQHAPKLAALAQILRDCGIGGSADDDEPASATAAPSATSARGPAAHRVLVFAQLKGLLDLVETELFARDMKGSVSYLRLDGSVPATQRFAIARRFDADPSIEVLLLTTHVGGLGLNLTAADVVVFLEHDWNPQRDLQAMDRAHRLGQTRSVAVYRLLTRHTLEARIMSLQRFKLDLANAVVTADNASMASMDTGTMLELFTTDKEAPATAAAAAAAAAKAAEGGARGGAAAVLAGLEQLWDEAQYAEEFAVDAFVAKMGV